MASAVLYFIVQSGLQSIKETELQICVFLFQIENENPVPAAFTKVKMARALELLRQHPEWTSTYRYISLICVSSLLICNVVASST